MVKMTGRRFESAYVEGVKWRKPVFISSHLRLFPLRSLSLSLSRSPSHIRVVLFALSLFLSIRFAFLSPYPCNLPRRARGIIYVLALPHARVEYYAQLRTL